MGPVSSSVVNYLSSFSQCSDLPLKNKTYVSTVPLRTIPKSTVLRSKLHCKGQILIFSKASNKMQLAYSFWTEVCLLTDIDVVYMQL